MASFAYAGRGRLASVTLGGSLAKQSWSYNGVVGVNNAAGDFGVGLPTAALTVALQNGATLDSQAFSWDRGQNKRVMSDSAPGLTALTRTNTYDSLSRLTATAGPSGAPPVFLGLDPPIAVPFYGEPSSNTASHDHGGVTMRQIHRIIGGIAAAVLIAAPGFAQQAANDFQKVTAKLDSGGTFYLYTDLRGWSDKVINAVEPLFAQIGGNRGNRGMAASVPAFIRAGVKALGLDQMEAFGASVLPLDDDMARSKCYLKLKEPAGIFSLAAAPAGELEGLKQVPADAAAAGAKLVNFAAVMPLVSSVATNLMGATGQAQVDKALASMKEKGIDIEALLASLDGEIAFWLTLDESRQVALPLDRDTTLTIARPAVVFMAKTKNTAAFDMLAALAVKKSGGAWKLEKDAAGDSLVMQPKDNPFAYRPLFAQRGSWMYFSTSAEDLAVALDTAKSGKDLRTSAEFTKVSEGMPKNAAAVGWASPKVARFMSGIRTQLMGMRGMQSAQVMMLGDIFLKALPAKHGLATWAVVDPEGWFVVSQGDKASASMAQSGLAPIAPILAAIAVPNFLEAQTRSKVSRVRSDQRSLATAVEAYFVDSNAYPAWTTDASNYCNPKGLAEKTIPSFTLYKGSGSAMTITTPIAYMTGLPKDPWAEEGATFGFYSVKKDDKPGWVMFSPGPDQKYDLDWKLYDPTVTQPSPELLRYTYDPTNGTVSPGDIIRVKQ